MYSHAHTLRRGLRQADLGQGERAEAVHVWEAEDQGRRDEGHQDGAYSQEGAEAGQAVDLTDVLYACRVQRSHWMAL